MKRIVIYGLCETFGGTEQYVLTMYHAIDRQKIQFDFLFDHAVGNIPYEEEITRLGGNIYRSYYKNRDRHETGAVSIRQLFQMHPEWDGIYLNCQMPDTSYRLLKEAKRAGLGIRMIHAHNNYYSHKPNWKEYLVKKYFDITKKFYITNFLACSDLAGKWMFGNTRFSVIPNPVNFEKFSFDPDIRNKMRIQYDIDDQTIVLGFCGRLVSQKDPEKVIRIFDAFHKKCKDSKLFLIGDGPLKKECEDLAEELNIYDDIVFTGAVSKVEQYMQMMDCFLLPSRNEGFGIVLLEAQAAGMNCFTSKDVVPKETNVTGHVYFIDKRADVSQWAEKIRKAGFCRYDEMDTLKKSNYTIENAARKLMKEFDRSEEKDECC